MDSRRVLRCGRHAGAVASVFILATWGASVLGHVVYGSTPGSNWWGVQVSGGVLYVARAATHLEGQTLTRGWSVGRNQTIVIGFVGIETRTLPGRPTVLVIPLWLPFALTALPTTLLWWAGRRMQRSGGCPHCGQALSGVVHGECPRCGVPCYYWLDRQTPIPSRTCQKCGLDLAERAHWPCPRCGTPLGKPKRDARGASLTRQPKSLPARHSRPRSVEPSTPARTGRD